jgi:hypothetical protein
MLPVDIGRQCDQYYQLLTPNGVHIDHFDPVSVSRFGEGGCITTEWQPRPVFVDRAAMVTDAVIPRDCSCERLYQFFEAEAFLRGPRKFTYTVGPALLKAAVQRV